jgi:hypothetical protein
MDKQKALQELKALQDKAKELEAIINAPDTPEIFCGLPMVATNKFGYYSDFFGKVYQSSTRIQDDTLLSGDLMVTREDALKAAAHRRLKMQAYQAMVKSWGSSSVPWKNKNVTKWVINTSSNSDGWSLDFFCETWCEFAFKTKEDLERFVKGKSKHEILFLLRGMQYDGPVLW